MAGFLSFAMVCFSLGDLGAMGTVSIASTLYTFGLGASNTTTSELTALIGLVEVIQSINNSRASREISVCARNSSQKSQIIGERKQISTTQRAQNVLYWTDTGSL